MNNNFPFSHRRQEPENSVLYIVGTPIGNLNDLSIRAVNILKNVSRVACEDTRQTKKLMSKFKISNNLISFNEHNSQKKIPLIINDLKEGKSVALVSDAGMPGICDPGENLIKNTRLNELDVVCIPGPSAVIAALVSSGMESSRFIFEGFLPKKKNEREKILEEISTNEKTTVLFEAPHRLPKLLEELKIHCGGAREIQIFRELTKKYEEHIGNNINEAIQFFNERKVIGEFTLVIKGTNIQKSKNKEFDNKRIKKELTELIDAGLSLSAASRYLAKKEKLSKRLIYNLY